MAENLPKNVEEMIASDKCQDAITALDELINQEPSAVYYFERGKMHWKMGHRSEAITDYEHAVAMDASSPAAQALQVTRDIMDFFNKDLYNP